MVKQGDIIWLDFDPQTDHEQKGRRPALVISNKTFNNFSSLAIVCPIKGNNPSSPHSLGHVRASTAATSLRSSITNTNKNHPFHVKLDKRIKTTGVILCDQSRTLDIKARKYEFIEKIPDDILFEVIDIISGFIEGEPHAR